MKEIRTEIEIMASPIKIWNILIDFENWNQWNPMVHQIKNYSSTINLDSKIEITMYGKNGGNAHSYQPTITIFEKEKILRWRAKMAMGLMMTNDKLIELSPTKTGTHLTHKELFSGLMAYTMWNKFEKGVPKMLEATNQALKKVAEQN